MSSSLSFKIAPPPRPSSASSSRPSNARASGSGSRSYHHSHNEPADDSSSDEDGAFGSRPKKVRDEAVTGFDLNGLTRSVWASLEHFPLSAEQAADSAHRSLARSKVKEKKAAPLMIASLVNKDWRAEASKNKRGGPRKREMYIPDAVGSMRVGGPAPGQTGADGSQGGLGTRDTINDAVVVGGLAMPEARPAPAQAEDVDMASAQEHPPAPVVAAPLAAAETDEQRAYRELISGGQPTGSEEQDQHTIAPASANTFAAGPQDETSAFRDDVLTRPDEPDLDAYARVPVGQFGAALLRGMGWTPGTAASRTGRQGPTEAYVPKSRPAMLGIGAKPLAETMGGEEKDRNGKVVRRDRRDDLRFVPLVKRERDPVASGSNVSEGLRPYARSNRD